jgi:hypothetical protein
MNLKEKMLYFLIFCYFSTSTRLNLKKNIITAYLIKKKIKSRTIIFIVK